MPDDVATLHGLAHGVQVDLIALINAEPNDHEVLLENALVNIGRVVTIANRLLNEKEKYDVSTA
jgi:hypothetical protein